MRLVSSGERFGWPLKYFGLAETVWSFSSSRVFCLLVDRADFGVAQRFAVNWMAFYFEFRMELIQGSAVFVITTAAERRPWSIVLGTCSVTVEGVICLVHIIFGVAWFLVQVSSDCSRCSWMRV